MAAFMLCQLACTVSDGHGHGFSCFCCHCVSQAVLEQRAEFGKRVVRKVPVEWIGVASEVKVMGDFDDWTRGHELSAEDVASDSVYSR